MRNDLNSALKAGVGALIAARHSAIQTAAAVSAATPGRVLPSSHSRNAPPAVET
jgi:hypothetical protein